MAKSLKFNLKNSENKKAVSIARDRLNAGGSCVIRTRDQRIKSPLLYRLS
jgi:hypothetical protein